MARHRGSPALRASEIVRLRLTSKKPRLYRPVSSSVTARFRADSPQLTISVRKRFVFRSLRAVMFSIRCIILFEVSGYRSARLKKSPAFRLKREQSSFALQLAERGSPSKIDISPKNSRGPNSATSRSPPFSRATLTPILPLSTMNISSPSSPSEKRSSPFRKRRRFSRPARISSSSAQRVEKISTPRRKTLSVMVLHRFPGRRSEAAAPPGSCPAWRVCGLRR